MVPVPPMFLQEWLEFPSAPCLAGKNLMTAGVSILLKSRASPDMLTFSLCNKKKLAILHTNTIDSVLRLREGGRAMDLSVPLSINP